MLGLALGECRTTRDSIAATEWKFSGVISDCGMAISNSSSTASIRFTIFSELIPKSLNCCSAGNG